MAAACILREDLLQSMTSYKIYFSINVKEIVPGRATQLGCGDKIFPNTMQVF